MGSRCTGDQGSVVTYCTSPRARASIDHVDQGSTAASDKTREQDWTIEAVQNFRLGWEQDQWSGGSFQQPQPPVVIIPTSPYIVYPAPPPTITNTTPNGDPC